MPAAHRVPPTVLVMAAVSSVQFGAALAKSLFDEVGAGGTVFLRVALAALVLSLLWRPRLGGHARRDLWLVFWFWDWRSPTGWGPVGNTMLLFVLFLLLGWKTFGPPIHP